MRIWVKYLCLVCLSHLIFKVGTVIFTSIMLSRINEAMLIKCVANFVHLRKLIIGERDKLGDWGLHMYTSIYEIAN